MVEDEIERRLKIIEAFKGKIIVRVHYMSNPKKGYIYYGNDCMKDEGLFIKRGESISEKNVMIVSDAGIDLLFNESDKTIEFLKENCVGIDVDPLSTEDYISRVIMEDIREAVLFRRYDDASKSLKEASLLGEGLFPEYLEFKNS